MGLPTKCHSLSVESNKKGVTWLTILLLVFQRNIQFSLIKEYTMWDSVLGRAVFKNGSHDNDRVKGAPSLVFCNFSFFVMTSCLQTLLSGCRDAWSAYGLVESREAIRITVSFVMSVLLYFSAPLQHF